MNYSATTSSHISQKAVEINCLYFKPILLYESTGMKIAVKIIFIALPLKSIKTIILNKYTYAVHHSHSVQIAMGGLQILQIVNVSYFRTLLIGLLGTNTVSSIKLFYNCSALSMMNVICLDTHKTKTTKNKTFRGKYFHSIPFTNQLWQLKHISKGRKVNENHFVRETIRAMHKTNRIFASKNTHLPCVLYNRKMILKNDNL